VPLIVKLAEGGTPDICTDDTCLGPDVDKRIEDGVFAWQRADWKSVKERMGPVAERYPHWAGPSFHLGRALANMGEWENAEAALLRSVAANPAWFEARNVLVWVLSERRQFAKAELAIRDGLALDSGWWLGRLALGTCLLRLGRNEEARSAALEAEGDIPRWPRQVPDVCAGAPRAQPGSDATWTRG